MKQSAVMKVQMQLASGPKMVSDLCLATGLVSSRVYVALHTLKRKMGQTLKVESAKDGTSRKVYSLS